MPSGEVSPHKIREQYECQKRNGVAPNDIWERAATWRPRYGRWLCSRVAVAFLAGGVGAAIARLLGNGHIW